MGNSGILVFSKLLNLSLFFIPVELFTGATENLTLNLLEHQFFQVIFCSFDEASSFHLILFYFAFRYESYDIKSTNMVVQVQTTLSYLPCCLLAITSALIKEKLI